MTGSDGPMAPDEVRGVLVDLLTEAAAAAGRAVYVASLVSSYDDSGARAVWITARLALCHLTGLDLATVSRMANEAEERRYGPFGS